MNNAIFTTAKPTTAARIKGFFFRLRYTAYANIRRKLKSIAIPFIIAERRTL